MARKKSTNGDKNAELNQKIADVLGFAESHSIPLHQTLSIIAYNLAEYSLWQTRGHVALVLALLLYSFENSVMKRTTIPRLDELSPHIKIRIDTTNAVAGKENDAATILLCAFQRSLEKLLDDVEHRRNLH